MKNSVCCSVTILWCCLVGLVQPTEATFSPEDECRHWSQVIFSPGFEVDNIIFGVFSLATPTDQRSEVWRSADGGRSWIRLRVSQEGPPFPVGISRSYTADQTLFIKDSSTVARSTDGGLSWSVLGQLPNDPDSAWRLEAISANEVFVVGHYSRPYSGSRERGVWHTLDGGTTWTRIYGEHTVTALAISPSYPNDSTLFIAPYEYKSVGGIYKSTDAGRTWLSANRGFPVGASSSIVFRIAPSPDYEHDGNVFTAGVHALYVSRDRGEHWDFRETTSPQEFIEVVVSPHYTTDGIVLAMGLDTGLMVSRDRGDHWSTTTSFPGWQPSYSGPINAFATGPASIGINVADYVSFDLGHSWSCLGSQTPPTPPEVPESSPLLLLGSGLAGLAGYLWRKRRAFSK